MNDKECHMMQCDMQAKHVQTFCDRSEKCAAMDACHTAITCNLWGSNIVDITDALFILRIQFEYTQTQCDEGARDVKNIWVPVVTNRITLYA